MLQHALQAFLVAAALSPFSYYAGRASSRLRLPQITGYLLSGVVCGPHVLGILSQDYLADLGVIEGACLGVIGLAAGAELHLAELARSKRQVVWLTAGICASTWIFCCAALLLTAPLSPALPGVAGGQLAAVASLGATLMMARSPASAIAVLKEMDAKGPFVSLVMGVVVLKDVVVIVLFALNMELVPLLANHEAAVGLPQLLLPLLSVGVSLTGGALGGYLMSLALQHQLHAQVAAALVHTGLVAPGGSLVFRCKQVMVLVLSTAVFCITRALDAEPLLACVSAGMLLANRRPPSSSEALQEELAVLINSIMALTNVAFFGLAGASLKLGAIAGSVWVALVVVLVRVASIIAGSEVGCAAGGVKSEVQQRCFWMSMVTQAGVAMGLARIAGTRFPVWGPAFQTVMVAVIVVNLLIGPPLFRSALIQVGEARAHLLPSVAQQQQQQEEELGLHALHQGLHRDLSASGGAPPDDSGGQKHLQMGRLPAAAVAPASGLAEVGSDEYSHHMVVSSGSLLSDLAGGDGISSSSSRGEGGGGGRSHRSLHAHDSAG